MLICFCATSEPHRKPKTYPIVVELLTGANDVNYDITYAAGEGEHTQITATAPYFQLRNQKRNSFYYISAQVSADNDNPHATDESPDVRIITVTLTKEQIDSFVRHPRKGAEFFNLHGKTIKEAMATGYGVASVEWDGN